MSIPGSASPLFLATAAAADAAAHQIDRSLRFNPSDNPYLFFNPSGHGNRKTFTFSFWVKRSGFGTQQLIHYVRSGAGNTGYIQFDTSDRLSVVSEISGSNDCEKITTQVFRDPSAWYHIVVKFDGANTNCDIYVNGEEVTAFDTNNEPSNVDSYFGGDFLHYLGAYDGSAVVDGYFAEVQMVNAQALAATDFGQEDSNGVWQPKAFSGASYGTNGFYLKFADNSSSAALGTDSSGNNNTWTVYNLAASDFTATFLNGNTSDLSGTPFNNTLALANLFDSDKTNRIAATGNSSIVYSPSPAITADSFRIHYQKDSGLSGFGLKVNDVDYTSSLSNGSNKQIDIDVQTLNKVEIRTDSSNQWVSLYYIEKLTSASGPGQDSLIDTPTNYTADSGNNGGNYATLNPVAPHGLTLANGNLDGSGSVIQGHAPSTIFASSGKFYCEFTLTTYQNDTGVGVAASIANPDEDWIGEQAYMIGYLADGRIFQNSSSTSYSSYAANDVIGAAFDADTGKVWFHKNGTYQNSGNPAAGTGQVGTITGGYALGFTFRSVGGAGSFNFGQRAFAYTPPTGFVSLCTQNLSESAYASIADGSTAFEAKPYVGNGGTQSITMSMGPDLVWIKRRDATANHRILDIVRGSNKELYPNLTNAESTFAGISSFNSNGFTLNTSDSNYNSNTNTYVAWAWDAGTSTASNTDGSVTSNVRASQANGCSVVTWTGSSAGQTVGHGLGAAPEMIIVKARNQTQPWVVYHSALGRGGVLQLHSDAANITTYSEYWGTAEPSSTVFGTYTGAYPWANNYGNMVAFCFAPIEGFSSFGSWTGNGDTSGNGPFVYTGFRPRWVMWKSSSNSNEHWHILDTARDPGNLAEETLWANLSNAETTFDNAGIDILSNGFKVKGDNAGVNGSGYTYIYAAFAEHPLRHARAR